MVAMAAFHSCMFILLLFFLASQATPNSPPTNRARPLASASIQKGNTDTNAMPPSHLPSATVSLSVGKGGPVLMQDTNLIHELMGIHRARVMPRLIHAKGTGAYGYFEATDPNFKKYTKSHLFATIGKKTPIFVRFSLLGGDSGSADSMPDLRGFAIKFYKETGGNWDLVGNNIDAFPIRDPMLFASLLRSSMKNPQTNLRDMNAFWDFRNLRPETLFHTIMCFSDLGLPISYRHIHGHAAHTFRLVNEQGVVHYAKFHWLTEQGLKNLSSSEAAKLAASNPDHAIQDLYESIANGNFPSWKFYTQIMTVKQAEKYKWDIFDITKIWPEEDVPMVPIGRFVLNQNPKDFLWEVDRVAFDPTGYIPGLEMTRDPVFSGRALYRDAQMYRLGQHFEMFPVNRPRSAKMKNSDQNQQEPSCLMEGPGFGVDGPNYFPNSFGYDQQKFSPEADFEVAGKVASRIDSAEGGDHFSQLRMFWNKLDSGAKERLVQKLAWTLQSVKETVKEKSVASFALVDPKMAQGVRDALKQLVH